MIDATVTSEMEDSARNTCPDEVGHVTDIGANGSPVRVCGGVKRKPQILLSNGNSVEMKIKRGLRDPASYVFLIKGELKSIKLPRDVIIWNVLKIVFCLRFSAWLCRY